MECFTDFSKVCKRSFLGADTKNLRRSHDEFGLSTGSHVGILLENDFEYTIQKFIVGVIAIGSVPLVSVVHVN
jgi:hypothetical protein